jgi:hypothetical protein
MEQVDGGKRNVEACLRGVASVALSFAGAALSLISLNPVGVVLGVAGIFVSGPDVAMNCGK